MERHPQEVLKMAPLFKALSIIHSVIYAVNQTETTLAGQPGATKRQQVINLVLAGGEAACAAAAGPAAATAIQGAVGAITDGWVAISNLVGLFRHTPQTAKA
jgi:hypothetical protein